MRTIKLLVLLLVLSVSVCACTVVDPNAFEELKAAIDALESKKFLGDWALRTRVETVLRSKSGLSSTGNPPVMKIQCIDRPLDSEDGGDDWAEDLANLERSTKWYDYQPARTMYLFDMLQCLAQGGYYISCGYEFWKKPLAGIPETNTPEKTPSTSWGDTQNGKRLCVPRWTYGFRPAEDVYSAAEDLDEIPDGADDKWYRSKVTTDTIAEAFITSNTPPPLPGGLGAFGKVLPVLCGLSASSWGCPSHPLYPGNPTIDVDKGDK